MACVNANELISYVKNISPEAEAVLMNPSEAIFEECVKMNCYYCGKYNNNWRCPPNLPNIDYKKMFSEYDRGLFLVFRYEINDKDLFAQIRTESSVKLHRALLALEKWLWEHNAPTAISFGGGSCKLCKNGCGKEKCNNPYLSRSPLEATGCNVIKTARKYGIDINFPTDKHLSRLGLVMWQE